MAKRPRPDAQKLRAFRDAAASRDAGLPTPRSRRSWEGSTDRLDVVMWPSLTQAGSLRSLRLCANVLKPASLRGGSQKWKLLLLLIRTQSCHFGGE